MKKGFTYIVVIGVGVLLTLALMAQFFLDGSREDNSVAVQKQPHVTLLQPHAQWQMKL